MKTFKNKKIYVAGKGIVVTSLTFDSVIKEIGAGICADEIKIPDNSVVLPGFIDTHVHGADGADFMDGTSCALSKIDCALAREGTTRFLATTMTQSIENISLALKAASEYKNHNNGLLGIHLEGPFISEKFIGAQPAEYVIKPNIELFDKLNKISGNNICNVTVAPEIDGAENLIKHLINSGIKVSMGHTAAEFVHIEKGMNSGADCITHMFNAQSGIHHRELGTAGAALLFDGLYTELIADGNHISFPAVKLIKKCKPSDKIILITDSMRAKGCKGGVSELGGQTVYIKNGEARLADGTLAGSVLKMNEAVRNLVEYAGFTLEEAVDCASANPAKRFGLSSLGSIKEGNTADFTVLDSDYSVVCTIRNGEKIYCKH